MYNGKHNMLWKTSLGCGISIPTFENVTGKKTSIGPFTWISLEANISYICVNTRQNNGCVQRVIAWCCVLIKLRYFVNDTLPLVKNYHSRQRRIVFFHLSNFIFRLRRQDELKFIVTKVDFSGMYISDSTSHWKNGFKRSRMSITLLYDHVE